VLARRDRGQVRSVSILQDRMTWVGPWESHSCVHRNVLYWRHDRYDLVLGSGMACEV
jgi:hypothetical protein